MAGRKLGIEGDVRLTLGRERDRLQKSVTSLNQSEQTYAEGEHEEGGGGGNPADVASDLTEQTLDASLEYSERERLIEVEAALHRLSSGQYGVCERCGQSITSDRLLAVPWTRFCIACASR